MNARHIKTIDLDTDEKLKKKGYPTKAKIYIKYDAPHSKTLRGIDALVKAGQRLRDLGYTLDGPPDSSQD